MFIITVITLIKKTELKCNLNQKIIMYELNTSKRTKGIVSQFISFHTSNVRCGLGIEPLEIFCWRWRYFVIKTGVFQWSWQWGHTEYVERFRTGRVWGWRGRHFQRSLFVSRRGGAIRRLGGVRTIRPALNNLVRGFQKSTKRKEKWRKKKGWMSVKSKRSFGSTSDLHTNNTNI